LYVIWPKELHLDLFEACNASCNFCATNWAWLLKNNENKFKQQFQAEIYLSLFKKIREAQTNSIALWMTGEPFLHKEIWKIIEWLWEIDINIWFLTNWYKLLENIKYIIKNKNIKHFYINISAWNIESFNWIRPKDNFENFLNVWKAIKILKIKRPDILVRWLYVITPQNICGIEDFLKLAIRNEIWEIELKRVIPYEHSKDYLYFSKDDIIKVKNIISKFIWKITIKNNFESTLEEFDNILTWKILQYTLEVNNEAWKTKNCYNPYFYINILRTSSYTCCKFITKIWKLSNLDLYTQLFDNNNISNIIYWAEDLEKLLWTERWKNNCNICQDMDTNNMVSEYIKLKNIWKRF
jgi:molybdenum cofactor biosynthesis enzyme MoaA